MAQTNTKPQLSIGGEFGFPTGQASTIFGSVLGASVKLELPMFDPHFNMTVTAGYSYFLTRFYYSGPVKSSLYTPVEAGGKYYFSKLGYIEGDLGFAAIIKGNYSPSDFIFAPTIGFSALTSKHKATIDIGLRYDNPFLSGNSIGQVAVRVAYRFGLK